MNHTIGIFVFDEVEVLDFAGPFEVFTTAARLHSRNERTAAPIFRVRLIGKTREAVRARAGLCVFPDIDFSAHEPLDVLVVPGGVVEAELARPEVTGWIAATSPGCRITASVCTGAFLLAQAGLLEGKAATTHWEDIEDFQRRFPQVRVQSGPRWVDEGAVVTSGGISAGIDMALHIVERVAGRALALRTARQMEFAWTENAATSG